MEAACPPQSLSPYKGEEDLVGGVGNCSPCHGGLWDCCGGGCNPFSPLGGMGGGREFPPEELGSPLRKQCASSPKSPQQLRERPARRRGARKEGIPLGPTQERGGEGRDAAGE